MAATMNNSAEEKIIVVETITKRTIKPCSPTPPHLRTFKLSFLDQLNPPFYTRFALFYYDAVSSTTNSSKRLQESLSETLTRFYPVAGRVKDHLSVDCNDEGVEYVEARALNCTLSDLLRHPNTDTLSRLVPPQPTPFGSNGTANPLLFIQATFFVCGAGPGGGSGISLALGVCISHKIADAASFSAFIKDWAATASLGRSAVVPDFTASASLFPPVDPFPSTIKSWQASKTRPVRYVFDTDKIAALKDKAASESVPHPSRVEAVSALIFKCQMAVSRSRRPHASYYALSWLVNLRARFVPPLPTYSFGNMVVPRVMRVGEEEVVDLRSIVSRLRRQMIDIRDYAKRLQGREEDYVELTSQDSKGLMDLMANEDVYVCSLNSWCKFPFYDADFGWGKPTWMTPVFLFGLPNSTVLLTDTRDGDGIEALMMLSEEDLELFQGNQELLTFASLNPSVLP